MHKYIVPNSVEDWIQSPVKTHSGGSKIWKAVVKSIDVIETNLSWNVGYGKKLRVGCNQQHRLHIHTVESLRQRGIFYLSQLAAPFQENRWTQSWISARDFELPKLEERDLARYIGVLNPAQVQLRDMEDILIWDLAPGGRYTPKEGYI